MHMVLIEAQSINSKTNQNIFFEKALQGLAKKIHIPC